MGTAGRLGRLVLAAGLAWLGAAAGARAAARWYTYEDCRLVTNAWNDGDSFHVRTRSAELVFRLYFVDAPETDPTYPDRVREQAAYWGLHTNQALSLGHTAAEFTRGFLGRSFTVYSRREDARGQGKQERFYALVKAGDQYLDEALVARGLARVYGMFTDLPDGTSGDRHFAKLRGIERGVRKQGVGGWGLAATGALAAAAAPAAAEPAAPGPVVAGTERVLDVNLAVYALDDASRFVALLKPGTRVTILRPVSTASVKVRYEVDGKPREGQCRRKDLGR